MNFERIPLPAESADIAHLPELRITRVSDRYVHISVGELTMVFMPNIPEPTMVYDAEHHPVKLPDSPEWESIVRGAFDEADRVFDELQDEREKDGGRSH